MTSTGLATGVTTGSTLLFRILLLLSAFMGFWLVLFAMTHIKEPDATLRFDRLARFDGPALSPPATPPAALQVLLPDDWLNSDQPIASAWYSTLFTLSQRPARLWAVYLPNAMMNAAVYLNGELIGQDGRMDSPITRNWSRPLFFHLPAGVLRAGHHELHIHVVADPPGTGLLGKIYLGPAAALAPIYERAYLIRVTAAQMSVMGALTMAFFMFVLWFMRRQDGVYLWFGIGLVCWSVHNMNIIVTEPPLPLGMWTRLMALTIVWVTICTAFYALRFLGERRPRSERALILAGTLSGVLMPFMPDSFFHPQRLPAFEILAMGIGLYATSIILSAYLRRTKLDAEIAMVAALGVCMMSTGAYDFLVIVNVIERTSAYMLPYSAPVVIVGFGFVLLYRFASALHLAENLNVTLERRVAEKSRELERNYEQLSRYQRQQAITEERQRIVRDMHDGVGGHLVSTLAAIDGGRATLADVSETLRDALNDLRLTIDSLDPDVNGLGQLLGLLRGRLEQQLEGSGIAVRWQVRPLPQWIELGPQESLHVLRIIQEAITNTLKHAAASTISVQTGIDRQHNPQRLFIDISDDGGGITDQSSTNGRGLHNMQARARKIGARLMVSSDPSGTRIRLLFERG